MLKEKIIEALRSYLLFLVSFFVLAFIATYFFNNDLILSKSNLPVVLGGITGGYLVGILIIYKKNK